MSLFDCLSWAVIKIMKYYNLISDNEEKRKFLIIVTMSCKRAPTRIPGEIYSERERERVDSLAYSSEEQ